MIGRIMIEIRYDVILDYLLNEWVQFKNFIGGNKLFQVIVVGEFFQRRRRERIEIEGRNVNKLCYSSISYMRWKSVKKNVYVESIGNS